jgi:type VI secretion system secreted protein VgrG
MATLDKRAISLATPLGKDVLLPLQATCEDQLGRPFSLDVQLLSEKGDINADDILGKGITLTLKSGDNKRLVNGVVTEFSQLGYRRRYHEYRMTVRPWFWLLTQTADCRIFQARSVPDIFEEVVKQYGFVDYRLKLNGQYEPREYCVQYRESDFAFLSRLLEEEGIYYFFEHTDGKHTMVVVDDPSAHSTTSGYEKVPFYPPDAPDAQRKRDHLDGWSSTRSVRTGTFATTDFDFEKPRQALLGSESISRKHAHAGFEVFDFPGELAKFSGGESTRVAKLRIQELQAAYAVMHGTGDALGLACGARFGLTDYPRKDLNIDYLVIASRFNAASDAYDAGQAGEVQFSMSVDAIDAKTPYRAPRITERPVVHGAQTAMVVGPSGEEIHTDKYGRIKVQFHWDRYGRQDDHSSCWMRVAQVWAGKQWGAMHIPRIGQEVIVSFLEGNPDAPIVTGRVYNGDSMPPYELPANKTQSGIKSRSSKGGAAANFNEIRFEDKKGSEQLLVHAEKNQDIEVENDETHWVGHDRTKTIDHDETVHVKHDRTETVDNNETITIGVDRTESVGSNEDITIGANRTIAVGGDESATVSRQRTHTVGVNETISIGAAQETTVGAGRTVTVGASQSTSIGANQSLSVGSNRTVEIGKDAGMTIAKNESRSVGEGRATTIGKDEALKVGKNLVIDAGDSVSIKTGSASITMKKDGTIVIKGKDITLEGSGKVNVKASSDVIIKGSKIQQN